MTLYLKTILSLIFALQLFSAVFLLSMPVPVQAYDVEVPIKEGVTSYDTSEGKAIGAYIKDIYAFAIGAVGIIATVVMMYGGVLWIVAGGNQTKISEAKAWIGAALTGLFLFMTSYMILYLINPNLTIFQPIKPATIGGAAETSPAGTKTIAPQGGLDEAAAATQLNNAGINYDKCASANDTCAKLDGLKPKTVNEIIMLKTESKCPSGSTYITSGTESGHAAGTYSHETGYKVDLRLNDCLTNYIETSYTKLPNKRSDGADMYVNSRGQCYAYESSQIVNGKQYYAHWDVKVAGTGCP